MVMGGLNLGSYSSNLGKNISNDSKTDAPQLKNIPVEREEPVVNKIPEIEPVSLETPENSVFGVMEDGVLGLAQARPVVNPLAFLRFSIFVVPLIISVVFLWATVSFLIRVWAKGAYYSGLIKACNFETYDFKDLGNEGKSNWKRYLKLAVYLFYKRLLSVLPLFGVFLIGAVLGAFDATPIVPTPIFIILGVIAMIWTLVYNIRLYFVEQYSLRLIISDNVPTKATFALGWKYYKTRPGKSLKLALALMIFIPLFIIILLVPVGLLGSIVAFLIKQQASVILIGFVGTVSGLLGIIGLMVVSPFINSVSGFSWTRLFLFIRETFDVKATQDSVPGTEVSNGQV